MHSLSDGNLTDPQLLTGGREGEVRDRVQVRADSSLLFDLLLPVQLLGFVLCLDTQLAGREANLDLLLDLLRVEVDLPE